MNVYRIFFLLLLILPHQLKAKPQIYFDYKVFYLADNSPYLETILQFSSGSLKFVANQNGNLQSSVEITQIFSIGDSIILADKYQVNSPEMPDSTIEDYFDVKRFKLEPNLYDYEIEIKDLNNGEIVSGKQQINIDKFEQNDINFSSISFIQSAQKTNEKTEFVKNGFFILPYLTNYFPPINDKIATYFEIYNTNKIIGENKKFMLTFEIEDFESGNKFSKGFKYQKFKSAEVVPVISYLSIDSLPSGDYNFLISMINENNEIVSEQRVFFQRRNDIELPSQISIENLDIANSFTNDLSFDSIPFYLNSLMPISPRYEYEVIREMLETTDTIAMQKYFHAFWVKTNSVAPYDEWLKYKSQVYYVEDMFGTQIKHGFETDRGRIFLQYGAPNYVMDRPNEPSSYPYQIWQYYRIGQRSNVRFVFYNPDLVTNDYPMLHSELPGEIYNYRWQHDLNKRNSPNIDIDDPNDGNRDHYGGNSSIYFNN